MLRESGRRCWDKDTVALDRECMDIAQRVYSWKQCDLQYEACHRRTWFSHRQRNKVNGTSLQGIAPLIARVIKKKWTKRSYGGVLKRQRKLYFESSTCRTLAGGTRTLLREVTPVFFSCHESREFRMQRQRITWHIFVLWIEISVTLMVFAVSLWPLWGDFTTSSTRGERNAISNQVISLISTGNVPHNYWQNG